METNRIQTATGLNRTAVWVVSIGGDAEQAALTVHMSWHGAMSQVKRLKRKLGENWEVRTDERTLTVWVCGDARVSLKMTPLGL